jgi:hypothetical protein
MIALLALALLQEPAPVQPPAEAPPPIQEPAPETPPTQEPDLPQEEGGVTLEEISAAMEQVSTRMAGVNNALRDAMRNADRDEAPPTAGDLGKAVDDARALVEDMEKLLALIPEPPPPPPDSGGSGNPQQPQQGNQPAPDRPQPQEPQDGEDGQDQESEQGSGERPPDAPMSALLQMPREGEWGNLPPRLQQTIDAASATDVPLRYRRWLVEYHRRAAGE